MPIEQLSELSAHVKLTGFNGKLELAEGLVKLAELTAGPESRPHSDALDFRGRVLGNREPRLYVRVQSVFHGRKQFLLSGYILRNEDAFLLRPHHIGLTAGTEVVVQTAEYLEYLIEQNRKKATEAPLEESLGSHLGNP